MTKLLVTLLFSVLMLCSCKQQKQDADVIIIDDDNAIEVNFEDVATNVRVVPIISETVIGDCSKLMSFADKTFMLDRERSVLYYVLGNKHVSTLNHQGNGPGEYNMISIFTYSLSNDMLYVYSEPDFKVFWYSLPDMKYQGFTPFNLGPIASLSIHDDSSFFVVRSSKDYQSTCIQLIDIKSGLVLKDLMQISGFAYAENDMVSYRPSNRVYAMAGYVDSVLVFSKDTSCETSLKYWFGKKNLPKEMANFKVFDNDTFLKFIQYLSGPQGDDLLCGNYYPLIVNDRISFWYHKMKSPFTQLNYFSVRGSEIINLKGLTISGFNRQIVPMGVSDEGYVYLFQGFANSYLDASVERSLLAEQIVDVINSQKENNPVLLYFDIK